MKTKKRSVKSRLTPKAADRAQSSSPKHWNQPAGYHIDGARLATLCELVAWSI
jgi:hypothetical protein